MHIKKKDILNYYFIAQKIRKVEIRIAKEYQKQEMRCPIHLSLGQEIPASAISNCLNKSDYTISYHRAHAHYISRGCNLEKMISEIYGKKTGCSKGLGGSMHLIDLKKNFIGSTAIVSSSIPVGVGFAYSLKLKKNKNKICIFIGDASVEEGVFFESLNLAVLKKLPIIFFCENNGYSVYTSLMSRQPKKRKIYKMAEAIGIKSHYFDSSDPIKLIIGLKKIIKNKILEPLFIEVKTYRYLEHCGPNVDDHLGYRKIQEINFWKKNDPLIKLEQYLIQNNILSKKKINNLKNDLDLKIQKAFIKAQTDEALTTEEFNKLINK